MESCDLTNIFEGFTDILTENLQTYILLGLIWHNVPFAKYSSKDY